MGYWNAISTFLLFSFAGPFFVIYLNKVKVYSSPVIEGVKKGDDHIWFPLSKPQLLCGDIMIKFYNKPKMSMKVHIHCSVHEILQVALVLL